MKRMFSKSYGAKKSSTEAEAAEKEKTETL